MYKKRTAVEYMNGMDKNGGKRNTTDDRYD